MRLLHAAFLSAAVAALALVAAADAGTIRRSVPAADMTIAVPTTWRPVDASTAASAAVKALADENPQLATILTQLADPATVIKFFAFDPAGAEGFATNVNVVVSTIPAGVTIQQYLAVARREILSLPSRVGSASVGLVRLPAGQAVNSHVRIALTARGKRVVTDITQWAFLRPRQSVVVSFTTTTAKRARYLPTFSTAARSIRFS